MDYKESPASTAVGGGSLLGLRAFLRALSTTAKVVLNLAEPPADFSRSDDPFWLVGVDRSSRKSLDSRIPGQLLCELLCVLFGYESRSSSCVPIGWSIALVNEGDVPDVLWRHVATSEDWVWTQKANSASPSKPAAGLSIRDGKYGFRSAYPLGHSKYSFRASNLKNSRMSSKPTTPASTSSHWF